MRAKNVLSSEMRHLYKKRDREVERILAGKAAEPGHEALRVVVEELRRAIPDEPIPLQVEKAHLALIAEAARLQSADSRSPETTPAPAPCGRSRGRAKEATSMPKRLLATAGMKVAAATLGVFLVFGGLAAAGVLPDQVQSAVSRAAEAVGVHLPDGSPGADAPAVPDEVTLPSEAKVPTTVPVAGPPAGVPGVPDDVTLPDQARVPETTPPVTVPGTVPTSLPVPTGVPPVTVPATVPTSVPPVTVPGTVPTSVSLPPTVPSTVPPLPR
jgi:hypothetical protein